MNQGKVLTSTFKKLLIILCMLTVPGEDLIQFPVSLIDDCKCFIMILYAVPEVISLALTSCVWMQRSCS